MPSKRSETYWPNTPPPSGRRQKNDFPSSAERSAFLAMRRAVGMARMDRLRRSPSQAFLISTSPFMREYFATTTTPGKPIFPLSAGATPTKRPAQGERAGYGGNSRKRGCHTTHRTTHRTTRKSSTPIIAGVARGKRNNPRRSAVLTKPVIAMQSKPYRSISRRGTFIRHA